MTDSLCETYMKTLSMEAFLDDLSAVAKKHGVNLETVDWHGVPMVNVTEGDGKVEFSWCFDETINPED